MTYPVPVYMGGFGPAKVGDIVDLYLDITADLVTGETISSVVFTVTDSAGETVANVIGNHTETATRTDFRVTAPTAGAYVLTAVFTISDGQKFTRIANLTAVVDATISAEVLTLIAELRVMIAEPTTATYSDADLAEIIARYPLIDSYEQEPDDLTWIPTYDLNATAANVWGKKAAAFAGLYDFTADGGTFHRSQAAKEMRAQARYYSARRAPSSLRVHMDPSFERDMQSTYFQTTGLASTDSHAMDGEFPEAEGNL